MALSMNTTKNPTLRWLLLAVLAAIQGCSTTPTSSFYALNARANTPLPGTEGPVCPNAVISVGPVVLPALLLRPQIVTRENTNRLKFNEFHRWGGQLDADVHTVLMRNLSVLLATDQIVPYLDADKYKLSFRVEVNIEQFDGQLDGAATLSASWTLTDLRTERRASIKRTDIATPITAPHYDGLVAAQSDAVATLSVQIAQELALLCGATRAVAQLD